MARPIEKCCAGQSAGCGGMGVMADGWGRRCEPPHYPRIGFVGGTGQEGPDLRYKNRESVTFARRLRLGMLRGKDQLIMITQKE